MMMKKLFVLYCLFGMTQQVSAQDYYTGKNSVSAGEITYTVQHTPHFFSLRQANSPYADDPNLYYKDGRVFEEEHAPKTCHLPDRQLLDDILKDTFTQREYQRLAKIGRDLDFDLGFVLDAEGTVIEMFFVLSNQPEVLAIAPETFARLEQTFRARTKWRMTEFGKQLKYSMTVWSVHWDKLKLDYSANGQSDSAAS